MEERATVLVSAMIQNDRSARAIPSEKALVAIRDEFTRQRALGHGRYPVLLDEASATEYEARAGAWLEILLRVSRESDVVWTQEVINEASHLLRLELLKDWEEIHDRNERFAKGSRGSRIALLDAAKTLAERKIENELRLLGMKADTSRLPLEKQLAEARYKAVLAGWVKANDQLDGSTPDLANAVKDAVGAVESLAKLVVAEPSYTLGKAINKLRSTHVLESPLLEGVQELWVWSNQEPGVRHGAPEEVLDRHRARYCLRIAEAAIGLLLSVDKK